MVMFLTSGFRGHVDVPAKTEDWGLLTLKWPHVGVAQLHISAHLSQPTLCIKSSIVKFSSWGAREIDMAAMVAAAVVAVVAAVATRANITTIQQTTPHSLHPHQTTTKIV